MKPKRKSRLAAADQEIDSWSTEQLQVLGLAVALLLALTSAGVLGYTVIEGWHPWDAFYMTIITLSTVGYGEVHDLSRAGEIFSSCLIIAGMCVAAYSFGTIGRVALSGELNRYRDIRKMNKKIATLKDHVIVCGFGNLSQLVVPELLGQGLDVVVIENTPLRILDLQINDIPYVEGDAFEDDVLRAAGIERANAVLAILRNDSNNMHITLSARALNPEIRIISRTEATASEKKLLRAGANQVVAPYRVSSSRLVQQLTHSHVNDFLEITTVGNDAHLALNHIIVPEDSPIADKTLESAEIRKKTGVLVAALIDSKGEMELSPQRDSRIKVGSTVIALGTTEGLDKFTNLLKG